MRKHMLALAGAVTISVAALTGCSAAPQDPTLVSQDDQDSEIYNPVVKEYTKQLLDGRTVQCLLATTYREVAISCDWENAK